MFPAIKIFSTCYHSVMFVSFLTNRHTGNVVPKNLSSQCVANNFDILFFKFFATVALSTTSVLGGSSSYGAPSQDFGSPIGVLSGGGGGGYDEPNTAAGGQVHRHVTKFNLCSFNF